MYMSMGIKTFSPLLFCRDIRVALKMCKPHRLSTHETSNFTNINKVTVFNDKYTAPLTTEICFMTIST